MIKLRKHFIPFLKECEKRGYPIKKVRFRQYGPQIVANVLTDWVVERDMGAVETSEILQNILYDVVPEEHLKHFFAFRICESEERFMMHRLANSKLQLGFKLKAGCDRLKAGGKIHIKNKYVTEQSV